MSKTIGAFRISAGDFHFITECASHHSGDSNAQELRLMVRYINNNKTDYYNSVKALNKEVTEIKSRSKKQHRIETIQNKIKKLQFELEQFPLQNKLKEFENEE